jgi:acetyl-CoA decarbonylase/synthase complex subunit gamma
MMNFTGSSTYTSLSGVRKEMRRALPVQISSASLGLIIFIVSKFL